MENSQQIQHEEMAKEMVDTMKRDHESLDDFEHLVAEHKDPLLSTEEIQSSLSKVPAEFTSEVSKEFEPIKQEVSNTISATKDFLADLTAEYTKIEQQNHKEQKEMAKPEEVEPFAFNKPLPKEPLDELSDFLKSESDQISEVSKVNEPRDSPDPFEIPPPVPKHQNLHDDSPVDAFEPSQTPEPDFDNVKPYNPVSYEEEPVLPTTRLLEPEPPIQKKVEPEPKKKELPKTEKFEYGDIGANDLFCKYGLDAWFNPERLHPRVESLVYWREPKKSGILFGVLMVSLLSLTYCSLISVMAYLCLATLSFSIAFRIYKNIMQAVQKTSDGHPFKEWLELDISISEERVKEASKAGVERLNKGMVELRRLFLVEDLVDSIKFATLLWAFTYVGAWFNGLTLVIMGVVAMFTLPKVYENNKSQVDAYISLATAKISEITNKVKAAVPMGKKDSGEKPKDQ